MSTGESNVFGMNPRTFAAVFIIVIATCVLAYQTVERGDDSNLVLFATSALSFLFGKAAGQIEATKPPKAPTP